MKYPFIARHRAIWSVSELCQALGVSRSGFYEWHGRSLSARERTNQRLTGRIRESFEASDRTYGSPRVWRDLLGWGERCGRHRVARLMRSAHLVTRAKCRRHPSDAGPRPTHVIAANLLDRDFTAYAPNQKWAADFTYVWTAEGWLYVAAVMDLYSRRIVGWSMQASMTSQLVIDALTMALHRRGRPREVLHHSDQGSQYASEQFQLLLVDTGIVCSMSKRGDCWDNAAMESFFSILKTERLNRYIYQSRDQCRAEVFDYIERLYNARRQHSTIGYVSPMQFEATYLG